jgi:hypothetical protein
MKILINWWNSIVIKGGGGDGEKEGEEEWEKEGEEEGEEG